MNTVLLEIMAASVVRRIALPRKLAGRTTRGESLRARMWNELSEHDKADIRQSVALAIIAAGLPDKPAFRRANQEAENSAKALRAWQDAETFGGDAGAKDAAFFSAQDKAKDAARQALRFVPFAAWRAAFIAARRALRMGNRKGEAEIYANPLPIMGEETRLDLNNFHAPMLDANAESIRRARIARRVRYLRACMDAAFAVDLSRKRAAGRKGALRFLRWLTAYSAGRGFGRLEFSGRAGDSRRDQALNDAKRRFLAYIEKGETALTTESLDGAPTHKREYKMLASIPVFA